MAHSATAAVVWEPGGPFSMEAVELGDLQVHEVLVKIAACGICHTDIKFQSRLPLPGVFGHEGTGTVEAIGREVRGVSVGDRVVLSYPSCGTCPSCEHDEPYRCENIPALKFGGSRTDGSSPVTLNGEEITAAFFQQSSFATHAVTHERVVVKVETDQEPEMLAALPCGVQTGAGAVINTFSVGQGDSIVIFGVGAVGLSAVMAAKMLNASPIIAVDMVESRLELALELGAHHALNAADPDLVKIVEGLLSHGARYALDCSATVAALNNAIDVIGQGGKVGIFSAPPPGQTFDFTTRGLFEKVASLHGIVQGHSVPQTFIPQLIAYQERGVFPLRAPRQYLPIRGHQHGGCRRKERRRRQACAVDGRAMSETSGEFPLNCWYALGWAEDFNADSIAARRVAGIALIVFRGPTGNLAALEDRCCHRQAPLSLGAIENGHVRCGYHGMKFAPNGQCIEIPGQANVPESYRVRQYPVIERQNVAYVWLGEGERSPADSLPDLYWHGSRDWAMRPRHIHVQANYQLVTDNILDFSHLTWLHDASFGTASAATTKGEVTRQPGGLELRYFYANTPITDFHTKLTGYRGNVDRQHVITWHAPAMAHVASQFWPAGKTDERPFIEFRSSHFLTPETDTTTNYYWTHANRADLANEEQMDLTYDVVTRAFAVEDRPMIEAQQRNIRDGQTMNPAVWDEALTLARHETARLLAANQDFST